MRWVGLNKAKASRGREALSLVSQSLSEFKNKENFMSDTNFDKLRGKYPWVPEDIFFSDRYFAAKPR